MSRELRRNEARELLERGEYGILSTFSPDSQKLPLIFLVWFRFCRFSR